MLRDLIGYCNRKSDHYRKMLKAKADNHHHGYYEEYRLRYQTIGHLLECCEKIYAAKDDKTALVNALDSLRKAARAAGEGKGQNGNQVST